MSNLLTPLQLAEYLKVPLATVYGWNARGIGPHRMRVGKHVRYREVDVQRWLDAQSAK